MKKLIIVLIISLLFLSSCVSVQAYEKMYINDAEMQLSSKKIESLENSAQTYREASSGAAGGKTGGGCGCN